MPVKTITRQQAIAGGLVRYSTGQPCRRGHVADRFTSSGTCVTCKLLWTKATRAANPEKAKEYGRAQRAAEPETARQRVRDWRAANLGRSRMQKRSAQAKRRSTIVAAAGNYTLNDIQRIYRQQRGRCAMPECRKPLGDRYHVDHIKPLARGGTNWPRNLQLLCEPCNLSKSASDPIDHAATRGRLV